MVSFADLEGKGGGETGTAPVTQADENAAVENNNTPATARSR